ncbi:MAG: helix-turn-helix transcriptional regulator [Clostridia bacterium]|nr:helix-turn-helix transcriptional regulator [Clostridia bacterium]
MFTDNFAKQMTEYCTAGKFVCEKQFSFEHRSSECFILLYAVSGTVDLTISASSYTLSPDSHIIIPAQSKYSSSSSDGACYFWCQFYIHGAYSIDGELLTLRENKAFSISLFGKASQSEKMRLLFDQLLDASRSSSPFCTSICSNFLEIILKELASERCSDGDINVEGIIRWIALNAPNIKKVSEVADQFGYSSEYLTTLLKKVTSKSITDHITESKIDLAKRLLTGTDLEISEISRTCGFSDDKYFFRVFKKICGITPRAYRTNKNTASN